MIRSERKIEEVTELFGGRLPYFDAQESDKYCDTVSLYNVEELDDYVKTVLHVNKNSFAVCVESGYDEISCEVFDHFEDAWACYKREAGEHTSGL